VSASSTQTENRISRSLLAADSVQRNVAATVGERVHLGWNVGFVGEKHVVRPEIRGNVQSRGITVNCNHVGSESFRDKHSTQPDAARADYCYPLTSAERGAAGESAERRGESAAQTGRRIEGNAFRDCDMNRPGFRSVLQVRMEHDEQEVFAGDA